jgi:5'-3' exonuclease
MKIPQKYALIDTANLYFRMKHTASKKADPWEKVGHALHLIFASVNKIVKKFGPDIHVVFLLEGHSWRKEFYAPYKKNRVVNDQDLTESEREESKLFWETFDSLITYLREKTNCSVLREPNAEGDDLIARFIHLHPDDIHYIISSDTDFLQLLAENVFQYNGITDQYITLEGYHDHKYNLIVDKKTKMPKLLGNPEFILFEKCMRGDGTDNVFSAYPGVRTVGSKNKTGLTEAFADRDKQGFNWNNIMLQRWVDHNGLEHRVRDDYERNKALIDLTCQPQEIKDACDQAIITGVRTAHIPNVGLHLMKFCGKFELVKIGEQADMYARWLNIEYKGIHREHQGIA